MLHFCRSYFKVNKEVKVKGQGKLNTRLHVSFLKVCYLPKIIKISLWLSKLAHFLHNVVHINSHLLKFSCAYP